MTLYKQVLATPEQVEFVPEESTITIRTDKGEFKGRGKTIVWRLARFLGGYKVARVEDEHDIGKVLTEAAKDKKREMVMLLDRDGNLVNVASELHKQMPDGVLYKRIEDAIKQVGIKVGAREQIGQLVRWSIEQEMKWVQQFIVLVPGKNNPAGRSAIYLSSGFVTKRSMIENAPACLNWSRFWSGVSRMANIDVERVGKAPVHKEFALREVHTNGEDKFEELPAKLTELNKELANLDTEVEQALNEPLKRDEMQAILVAYNANDRLPGYAIELVLGHVEHESVWGISQALSWVGTHEKLRGKAENKQLADDLAKISGEMLSLSPFINALHGEFGAITEELLFNPPEKFASQVRVEKPVKKEPKPKPAAKPKKEKKAKEPKTPKAKPAKKENKDKSANEPTKEKPVKNAAKKS